MRMGPSPRPRIGQDRCLQIQPPAAQDLARHPRSRLDISQLGSQEVAHLSGPSQRRRLSDHQPPAIERHQSDLFEARAAPRLAGARSLHSAPVLRALLPVIPALHYIYIPHFCIQSKA